MRNVNDGVERKIPSSENVKLLRDVSVERRIPNAKQARYGNVERKIPSFENAKPLRGVVNIPIEVSAVVGCLPRNIPGDAAIDVHVKRRLVSKDTYKREYDPLMTIGALLGAAVSGSVSQALGRKSMLTVISLGFMSGWMVIYLSRGHIFHIYSGRFLTGFAMGLISLVSPCYISEVTLPHNRGTMGGMLQMAITMGILYCYLLGRFFTWDYLALACMLPAALLCIASMFCVESPRWHLLSGRKATPVTLYNVSTNILVH
ncbi:uncharacterized protein LOC119169803 [Rhipicephalus microplus]|uniref:uncharacterized protein LOC119169803 n=1 Tax=Rhipicephalus microplus TaxID=6941 RepID=UPI003F6B65B7